MHEPCVEFRGAIVHHCGKYNVTFAFLMDLLWLLLEAGVALALLLGIVWWTWPRRARERETRSDERDPE